VAVIEETQAQSRAPLLRRAPSPSGAIWLSTEHWLLMTATPAYAPLLARMHARNGDHFRLGMTLEPGMSEASFWEPILEEQQRSFANGSGLYLLGFLKGAGRPEIGCAISFSGIVHEEFETCWLGYRLDRSLEGRGLMHSALAPAIAAVFERYKLHRIMASHQPENLRSGRLLRRLGFGVDGYARDFMKVNGKWCDNVLLALLAPGC
jgi:ribosomal-protein-alanine N-acetyltransferase